MPSIVARLSHWIKPMREQFSALVPSFQAEPLDFPFANSDIAQLHRVTVTPGAASLDDQTWNDLLLDPYLEWLSEGVSIFGRQALYLRLRNGVDDAACDELGERIDMLRHEPAVLDHLRDTMQPLRDIDTEVAVLLHESERPADPAWAPFLWVPPAGLAASLLALLLTQWAWLGVAAALYLLVLLQLRYHRRMAEWQRSVFSLQMLLRACSLLEPGRHPLQQQLAGESHTGDRISGSLSRSAATRMVPVLGEYADWFLVANVKHYFKTIHIVFDQREFLRECYLRYANLEADAALARHQLRAPVWCPAQRRNGAGLKLEGGVHPLLGEPAPLSIALARKGAFISGQNGVGKSTFLRMVGLNLVTARAFGFCYARHAVLPMLPVYASMQSEDSLLGGESLYMAELRRARELLAAADGQHKGVYIIDEIFRGTNHLESVSAAAAVLDVLAAKGLVIVSSHNLVLAPLLAHRLDAFAISRAAKGGLALAPGVLARTNGLALLAAHGFDTQVQASAGKVSRWLSGYLAHPAGEVGILADEDLRSPKPVEVDGP